jgi:two-component system, NtrC family, response regulator HydG
MIEKAASVDLPVLLVGETGTGKELIAREIHQRSLRKSAPFVPVNTGVLTKELVASELFGHVRGAFTGADNEHAGRFSEADKGTLFLDEIITMEDNQQVALLRVLESGEFRPIGANKNRKSDVRIIAATNAALEFEVRKGRFRRDLQHRLQVFSIPVPPLRKRTEDIPMLSYGFLRALNEEFDLAIEGISDQALRLMAEYAWPGNVRELKNVIAQAAVMAGKGVIGESHLPVRFRKTTAFTPVDRTDMALTDPSEGIVLPPGLTLEEVEKRYIQLTLAEKDNNKTHAARVLGISRKTLHDRLKRWEL